MRVLLFGAQGQLGRELAAAAGRHGIEMIGLSRSDADIRREADVARAVRRTRPAVVINAAAYTAVDRAEEEPEAAFLVNAAAPGVVAATCAAAGIPLLHVSTDYVFDGSKTAPYVESDPVAPLGVYGRSKEEGERAVRGALARHLIVRTSWVYGVYGTNFLKTMLRLAQEREALRVVADQHGCPTASADLAAGLLAAAGRAARDEKVWGTYHLAGTEAGTWHEFAAAIIEAAAPLTGRRPAVQPIATADFPTRAKRPANSRLDSTLFARTFGFVARPWRERVGEIVLRLQGMETGAAR